MLDPKIVAASTQRPAEREQGTVAGGARRSGSSHGNRTETDTPN
ncbi:MAG TPA: hypothetical protein VFV83_05485 [Chthoniobacteraceae bacterium]|nr:hypothetical protein [Chthoniobacteraceae bacterium]